MEKVNFETIGNYEFAREETSVKRMMSCKSLIYALSFLIALVSLGFTVLAFYLQKCNYENNLSAYKKEFKDLGIDEDLVLEAILYLNLNLKELVLNFIYGMTIAGSYSYALDWLSTVSHRPDYAYDYVVSYGCILYFLYDQVKLILIFGLLPASLFIIFVYFLHVKLYKNKKYAQSALSLIYAAHLAQSLSFLFSGSSFFIANDNKLNEYSSSAEENNEITNLLIKYNVKPENAFIYSLSPLEDSAYSISDFFQKKIIFNSIFISRFTHKQICSVLSHELGHIKSSHTQKRHAFNALSYSLQGVLIFYSFGFVEKYVSIPKAIVFVLFQGKLLDLLHTIIFYAFLVQGQEYEADGFSAKEGYGKELIESFVDFLKISPSCYDYNFLYNSIRSHPSVKKRNEKIKEALE